MCTKMANLTRIKNNQITDSTILANTKIVPGSIVGSLFNSNLTMTSDVTITGNLVVQGSSSYLSVASTNTYVNDPLIVLNNAFSGTNTYDIGLLFNRGNQPNSALIWKESAKEFQLIYTTETGSTYGNIAQSAFANIHVSNIAVQYNMAVGTITATGNVDAISGITTAGGLAVNGGGITTSQATASLFNATATTVSAFGAATTLTLGATSGTASLRNANIWLPNATTLDGASATIGVFNNATTVTAFDSATSANIGAGTGTFTINNPTLVGQQATQNLYNTLATTMNFAGAATSVVTGATTGTYNIRNANLYLPNATTIYSGQTSLTIANTVTTSLSLGGATTVLNLGGSAGVTNLLGAANIQITTAATDNLTGALQVSGGVGIKQSLYARDIQATAIGNVTAASGRFTTLTSTSTTNLSLTTATAINNTPIGNATPSTGVFTNLDASGIVQFTNTSTATSVGSGALRITGGASVGGNLYIGGNVNFVGSSYVLTGNSGVFYGDLNGFNALYAGVTGYTALPQTVFQTSANFNGYVQNNFENLNTSTKASTDWVATAGDGSDTSHYIDMGIVTSNWDGTQENSLTTAIKPLDGYLYVQGNTSTPGGNLVIGASSSNMALKVIAGGNTAAYLVATFNPPNTVSSSKTSGALVVTGGVGVSGDINASNVTTSGSLNIGSNTESTSTSTGALVLSGGLGIAKNTNIGGNVKINATTQSISATTGALVVTGGAGFGGDVWVNGNLFVANIVSQVSETLVVQDPLVYLSANVPTVYNYDLGFYSHFYAQGLATANVYQHTGVVRDNADNTWKFFSNVGEPSAGVITFDSNTIYDPVKAGNLQLTFTTTSTNSTSGALQVAGGAGIGGNIFIGGAYLATSSPNAYLFNTSSTTVNAFGAAATLNVGATSGTFTLNNPTLVGSQATQAVFNTTATTVNAFGAATALNLGASTGTASLNNANLALPNATTIFSSQATVSLLNQNVTTLNGFGAATALTLGATTGTASLRNANIWLPNATTVDGASATIGVFNNATTVAAFDSATSANIGAGTGTFTINNPTLVGQQPTQNLYNTIATTMNFAGAATTLNLGAATGTASINNAILSLPNATNIAVSRSSITLANTNATTVNAFGAATTLNFGASTGTTTVRNSLSTSGILYANSATASTSSTTGGLVVAGGAGIAGSMFVGIGANIPRANITSTVTSTQYNNGALIVSGGVGVDGNVNLSANKGLTVGQELAGVAVLTNAAAQFFSNINSYSQVNHQNINSGSLASADFIATANNGTDTSVYVDLGIASSNYAFPGFEIIRPNDSYLISNGGNLLVGSTTKDVVFFANTGAASTNDATQVARIVGSTASFNITSNVIATSPDTGALRVTGGAGFTSNIWVANGAVINNSQTSDNFVVKGKNTTSLIATNSNYGAVVIGGSNASPQLGSTLKVNSNDSIMIPVGTSAQRPGNSGNIDVTGMVRFNTTINNLEFYDGSAWQVAGTTFTVITDRQFADASGNPFGNVDGTNTSFTIQSLGTTSSTLVSINGVVQFPTLAYSVSGTTLTFTEAPALGDVIDVRVLTTTISIDTIASGPGLNQFIADTAGAQIWSGSSSTTQRVNVSNSGVIELVNGTKTSYEQTGVNVSTTATPVIVDSFSTASYSSAKYIIQVKQGAANIHTMETLVVQNGTTVAVNTYANVNIGGIMGTITANIVSGNAVVYYTSTSVLNSNVKVQTTYIV